MIKYLQILLAVTLVLSFYLWQQTEAIRLGYKVDNLSKECEKWEQQNDVLKLKINEYLSMERLDQIAKQKGLIHPQDKDIIYLEND
ncbi:MAG: hypothetical protein LHV68_11930 [Elusimicrobia bacterium]|nr:hypothetical protein [Candidatus Liberimonas magnetica]